MRDLEHAAAPVDVTLAADTRDGVDRCHRFLGDYLGSGAPVYGSTTGFGPLVDYSGRPDSADQCENVLAHLSAGHGPDLDVAVVRATMLVRLWSLCQGRSGVSLDVVDALTAALGTGFAPAVPSLGSVGASGDLIPLSYLANALRGNGNAYVDGVRMPARDALSRSGLSPLLLAGRDALALVNGTSLTAAAAGLALAALQRSVDGAVLLSALLTDVLGAAPAFANDELLTAYGHPQTVRVGKSLRDWLAGSRPTGTRSLQEPYSVRCVPQLVGAAGSALSYAAEVIKADLNGVSDNPLCFAEHGLVAHGGNFFGQPVAFAADMLTLVATQLGNLAERQLDLLIDPHRNGGLPPMLSVDPGRQHGVQGVQLAATAIVADMRRTATPASIQSLPTNLHNQDIVPFGTQAALNALAHARSLRTLQGSLALALRQAVHVGARTPTAVECAAVHAQFAERIPAIDSDRALDNDVNRGADLLDEIVDAYASGAR
ncbi:MAG TPA: aromatic amino acid ammonia-lyase [Pseudonocardiaceae bacterium]|nr:aromatic amino acid ammonia-lyase [Pseudonocardiaceae bacterium]